MVAEFEAGDRVSWETSQGTTHGRVVRRQTSRTRIRGHTVAASPDAPQYIVESDVSGERAAHRPEALTKL